LQTNDDKCIKIVWYIYKVSWLSMLGTAHVQLWVGNICIKTVWYIYKVSWLSMLGTAHVQLWVGNRDSIKTW
jgi:NADPH-dependent 7-cyano-7-deazaguanine reductase QueF-like protein